MFELLPMTSKAKELFGSSIPIKESTFLVGRAKQSKLMIPDEFRQVSTKHCLISIAADGSATVQDLSTNGTFISTADGAAQATAIGKNKSRPLQPGDVITVSRAPASGADPNQAIGFVFQRASASASPGVSARERIVTPPPNQKKPASQKPGPAKPVIAAPEPEPSGPAAAPGQAPAAQPPAASPAGARASPPGAHPAGVNPRSISIGERSTHELLKQRNETLAAQNKELLNQIAQIRDKYHSSEAELSELRARLETEVGQARADSERAVADERAQGERALDELRARLTAQLETARGRAEAADAKAASLGETVEALEREKKERSDALQAAAAEAASLSARLSEAEGRAESLARTVAQLQEEDKVQARRIEALEGDLGEARGLLSLEQSEASKLRDSLGVAQSRAAATEAERSRLATALEAERHKATRLDAEKRRLESSADIGQGRAQEARDAVLQVLGEAGLARDSVQMAHVAYVEQKEGLARGCAAVQQAAALLAQAMEALGKPESVGAGLEGALASLSGIAVAALAGPGEAGPGALMASLADLPASGEEGGQAAAAGIGEPSPVRRGVAAALREAARGGEGEGEEGPEAYGADDMMDFGNMTQLMPDEPHAFPSAAVTPVRPRRPAASQSEKTTPRVPPTDIVAGGEGHPIGTDPAAGLLSPKAPSQAQATQSGHKRALRAAGLEAVEEGGEGEGDPGAAAAGEAAASGSQHETSPQCVKRPRLSQSPAQEGAEEEEEAAGAASGRPGTEAGAGSGEPGAEMQEEQERAGSGMPERGESAGAGRDSEAGAGEAMEEEGGGAARAAAAAEPEIEGAFMATLITADVIVEEGEGAGPGDESGGKAQAEASAGAAAGEAEGAEGEGGIEIEDLGDQPLVVDGEEGPGEGIVQEPQEGGSQDPEVQIEEGEGEGEKEKDKEASPVDVSDSE